MKHIFFTILALFALTSNARIYSGNCGALGDNVKWGFNDQTGLLYIYGWGNMKYSGYAPWYTHSGYITSVTVEQGVNNIEDFAFQYCYYIKTAKIPPSVATIGEYAFAKCHALKEIVIPYGVKSIQGSAFYDCRSLSFVELPGSLEEIGPSAFRYCAALPEIKLPEGLKNIGAYAFEGCHKIDRLEIPSTVRNINNYAFSYCNALSTVIFKDGAENLGEGAFSYNKNLIYVELPASLKSMGEYQFYSCSRLQILRMLRFMPLSISANCFWYSPIDKCILFISRPFMVEYLKTPVWKDFGSIFSIMSGVDFMTDGIIYESISSYYGEAVTLPDGIPQKRGHRFVGWENVPYVTPAHNIQINAIFDRTSSVEDTYAEDDLTPVDVYAIDGRLIHRNVIQSEILKTLSPGFYIINGKKVAVR